MSKKFNEMKVTRHGFWAIVSAAGAGLIVFALTRNVALTTIASILAPFAAGVGRELYGKKRGAEFSWSDVWLTTLIGWVVPALGWLSVWVGNFWQLPK